ncbi:unnamed protein product [Notodromas monacha]|uniref:Uncharacterized protein n=1 Tax=Notodromas monacha TaxID=399045 RepID=A0A7R9GCH9_9CRUS|nr:unnamed protein product [Notodromas monacha]CAG0916003.1 unnamed protein product [Notodromas monacha]
MGNKKGKASFMKEYLRSMQGMDHQFQPFSRNGIEITGEELQRRGNSGLTVVDAAMCNTLQVRRGSEPSLNRIGGPGDLGTGHSCDRVAANGVGSGPGPPALVAENKRWSAAPIIDDDDEARLLKPIEFSLFRMLRCVDVERQASAPDRFSFDDPVLPLPLVTAFSSPLLEGIRPGLSNVSSLSCTRAIQTSLLGN